MTLKMNGTDVSRRGFLISTAAAGGGLALGLYAPWPKNALAQTPRAADGSEVGAWVFIKPNDDVVIRIARSEMGQGTLTGLAQLVAEELECDWNKAKLSIPRRDKTSRASASGATCRPGAVVVFAAHKSTFARAAQSPAKC